MALAPAYLDYHSTSPVDPRVVERMLPFFTEHFGNASSKHHRYGWFATEAVEVAREQVAGLLGATAREIVFTSGATEANNIAIQGVARARSKNGRHLITQATEHKAVLDVMGALGRDGFEVTVLPVDAEGRVDPDRVASAIRDDTTLVSIMTANNEVGTLHDLIAIGQVCRERGIWLHTDATQSVGKLAIDLETLPVDLLSLSAHKFCGPKGVGALYLRRRSPRATVSPIVFGGGHERGVRSGTLNVPGIVGLGSAAEIAGQELADELVRVRGLRDALEAGLKRVVPDLLVHGPNIRLYNNLNVSFPGVEADALLTRARDVAASTGSACTSESLELSHVLRAMSVHESEIRSAIRLSPGRFTTNSDIDRAVDSLGEAYINLLRSSK